ncbi:MAG: hypothetical protein COV66_07940 [Nitrospinae bacterium CG11_big_fil_rev_8_21_14_0_20_45_15]|nr:MAG: hypothetical protein COV66_07940 [Nitrospinae bacterium CG11_big_fil_rev_8_21_14_0_20_45_15]
MIEPGIMDIPLRARFQMPTRIFLCLIALLFTLSCLEDPAEELIQKANQEWIKGQNSSSVELFKSVLKLKESGHFVEEALFRLGEIHHLSLDDDGKAIGYFKELIDLNPKGEFAMEAQRSIADLLEYDFKDYEQAIIENQRLINSYNNLNKKAERQFRIASIYYKMQNYEQALSEHEALLEEYPSSPSSDESDFKILEILYSLGRCSEVEDRYNQILNKNPDSKFKPEMEFVLASCIEEKGNLPKALEKFKALEEIYPYPSLIKIKVDGLIKRIKKKK